jgi:hypothetical protein
MNICPLCSADLRGEPIPEGSHHLYGGTHFSRVIGWDGGRNGIYDGVVAWACPDCGGWWHRFPKGDPIRERVARMMNARHAR